MKAPKKRLDSSKVAVFAKRVKTFTTDRVASQFKVGRQQAAAAIAILRIKDQVQPAAGAKDPSGSSHWTWSG